jgi:hypothetical protein
MGDERLPAGSQFCSYDAPTLPIETDQYFRANVKIYEHFYKPDVWMAYTD